MVLHLFGRNPDVKPGSRYLLLMVCTFSVEHHVRVSLGSSCLGPFRLKTGCKASGSRMAIPFRLQIKIRRRSANSWLVFALSLSAFYSRRSARLATGPGGAQRSLQVALPRPGSGPPAQGARVRGEPHPRNPLRA